MRAQRALTAADDVISRQDFIDIFCSSSACDIFGLRRVVDERERPQGTGLRSFVADRVLLGAVGELGRRGKATLLRRRATANGKEETPPRGALVLNPIAARASTDQGGSASAL